MTKQLQGSERFTGSLEGGGEIRVAGQASVALSLGRQPCKAVLDIRISATVGHVHIGEDEPYHELFHMWVPMRSVSLESDK